MDRSATWTARVLVALLLMHGAIASDVAAAARSWTRPALLTVSDQEARRLGYDPEQMSVSFDPYNTEWRGHVQTLEHVGPALEVENRLQGRDYWAVYYGPLTKQLGGDLWVFVDRETSQVIGSIRGQ